MVKGKHIYGIYEITKRNNFNDLIVLGLPHYINENPDEVISHEENKEIRLFLGRNYNELGNAFRKLSKDEFIKYVEKMQVKEELVEE